MKIEKINENKVKITLTIEELKQRKINIQEIEKDAELARDLFLDLIEESNIHHDFVIEDSQLYIEASSDNNNLFIVTITKVDNIPEISSYSSLEKKFSKKTNSKNLLSKETSNSRQSKEKFNYKVDSHIYTFESLDNILDMCLALKQEKLFLGKNSLYKDNNKYFLIFSKSSVKNSKFVKTFIFLSEYCNEYYTSNMFEVSVREKCKLVIEKNALQTLIKL